MRPFNLEECLKNPNLKVVTRDGRAVTKILCINAKGDHPIIALVESHDGTFENSFSYTNNGKIYSSNIESCADLFFASEKKEGWINLFRDPTDNEIYCSKVYPTKERAMNSIGAFYATIKVEWEE